MFCMIDAIQGVISGILRGAGKQLLGAVFNLFAFYVIGLPLSFYFCFYTPFGVNGLMLGISGGVIIQDIACGYLLYCCQDYIFPVDAVESKSTFTILNDEDDEDGDDSNVDDSFKIAISNYDNDNNENNNESNIKIDKNSNNVKTEKFQIEMTDI
jgi:hypothetical protein